MTEARLEAVLWDLDGVIADTGPYHYRAWRSAFRNHGVAYDEESFRYNFGLRNDTIIRKVMGEAVSPAELEAIAVEKEEGYRRRVAGNVVALPGVVPLLQALNDSGIRMAIGSSAPPENIRLVIESLGIEDCFQAIAYGREVAKGKPSPEIYLLAASKLGVVPRNCLVVEDAMAGVTAAKQAGMKCLAVTNTNPAARLGEADLVTDSLAKIDVCNLRELFASAK